MKRIRIYAYLSLLIILIYFIFSLNNFSATSPPRYTVYEVIAKVNSAITDKEGNNYFGLEILKVIEIEDLHGDPLQKGDIIWARQSRISSEVCEPGDIVKCNLYMGGGDASALKIEHISQWEIYKEIYYLDIVFIVITLIIIVLIIMIFGVKKWRRRKVRIRLSSKSKRTIIKIMEGKIRAHPKHRKK